jgi:dUTP pyrophosphatase
MNIRIKKLHEGVPTPSYAHVGDAGFDLIAAEDVIIEPGETVKVPTGLAFEIPDGYELQVRPRSGITAKTKLRVQLGTVDAGYRGEVSVIVDNAVRDIDVEEDFFLDIGDNLVSALEYFGAWNNFDKGSYLIRKGDRIAQAVLAPIQQATFIEVDELSETTRGEGGFGSTGTKKEAK